MIIPFVGDAYKAPSINLNAQTCINLYGVLDSRQGKTPSALYKRPGLRLFADDSDHYSVRGLYETNGLLYGVADADFYRWDALGYRYHLGTLASSAGRVLFESSGFQIMITEEGGDNYYVYDLETGEFETNPAADFPKAQFSAYQDGYGILPVPNTARWYVTDLFDFAAIDPLDFASAISTPDNLVTAISRSGEVFLFKNASTVVWYNTGDVDFPFEPRQTLVIRYGIAAGYSLALVDNTILIWLGRNEHSKAVVVQLTGYEAEPVSTEAIENEWATYEKVDDAFGFVFRHNTHVFYVITFPTADRTWIYDLTTKGWYEWRSELTNNEPNVAPTRQGRWRPNCYALFNNQHIVGDFESGKLFVIDPDTYTDNGTAITWERTAYHISDDEKYLFCSNFQLIVEGGKGLTVGQGSDPQVMLQVSRDYGHTFLAERWRSMGALGQFKTRVIWASLGAARDWVFRVRGTDPIKIAILGARADFEKGAY